MGNNCLEAQTTSMSFQFFKKYDFRGFVVYWLIYGYVCLITSSVNNETYSSTAFYPLLYWNLVLEKSVSELGKCTCIDSSAAN